MPATGGGVDNHTNDDREVIGQQNSCKTLIGADLAMHLMHPN